MSARRPFVSLALILAGAVACASNPGGGVIDDSLDGSGGGGGVCGDGMVEGDEQCDDENDDPRDDCTNECREPACGDGIVQGDEDCDDGDDDDGNACTASCTPGPTAVASVAAGDFHSCAVSQSGTVRCWGAPDYGRLGQPGYTEHIGDDEPPNDWDPVEAGADVVEIVSSQSHNCVLRSTGSMLCWGYNSYGQLGLGHSMSIGDDEPPIDGGDLPLADIVDIAVGDSHTCAVDSDGAVRCWGNNGSGQLGTGDTVSLGGNETIDTIAPIALPGPAVEVVAGYEHSCARLDDGNVACWGRGIDGQLGYGTPDAIGDDESPASAGTIPLGGTAIDIATRHNHTCAVLEGGGVRCWGDNSSGQLGYGDTKNIGDRKTPAEVGDVMLEEPAIAIATGSSFTCAHMATGAVRCWGSSVGLGVPDLYGDQLVPQEPAHVDGPVRVLAVGADHLCAIMDSSAIRCWGSNTGSALGYPELSSNQTVHDPDEYGDVAAF